jgi:rod shape determining protein RodA
MTIAFCGVVLIYSASTGMNQSYWTKQLIWLGIATAGFFAAFKIKTDFLSRIVFFLYVTLVFILAVQIVAGEIVSGVKSWIKLGFFNIQVSEFIKIPLALYMAKILAKISTIDWKEFFKIAAVIGCPFVLIAMQPDLGTAFMLTSFFITAVFLKKIRPIIVVFSLIILLLGAYSTWNYVLKPYQRARIVSFLNPQKYKKSTGYQIIQSRIAIGSGGLTGQGYLNGTQSQYKFLPTRHTDFIVALLGEEFGFIGVSFLLLLFFIFFYRQFNFKSRSDTEFYFIYLFNGIILFQFLINILMTIGWVPILGVPLPFVSYGGSSLLAFFIGEGLIFRMKINTYLSEY